VGLEDVKEAGR